MGNWEIVVGKLTEREPLTSKLKANYDLEK